MLILKYFLTVGAVLIAGLFALSAHLAPSGSAAVLKPTTASLPLVVAEPPKPEKVSLTEPVLVPAKKDAKSERRSKKAHHRRHATR